MQAALGLFGMIGGPILGLFILGIVYPWTNYKVRRTMLQVRGFVGWASSEAMLILTQLQGEPNNASGAWFCGAWSCGLG